MKRVLVDKSQVALKSFTSGDNTRHVLSHIHITEDYAEATDGSLALRIPHTQLVESDDYPELKSSGEGITDALVEPELLEKALKNVPKKATIPVLQHVLVTKDDDRVIVSSTDLTTEVHCKQDSVDGNYVDLDSVIPQDRKLTVKLSAAYLKTLATWAEKYGEVIEIYAGEPNDIVLFNIPRAGELPATAILAARLK